MNFNTYRQAVIILGMHRSGTSAAAGTAVRLGLAAPRTPLAASDDNPSGFYESETLMNLSHKMILAQGGAWNVTMMIEPETVASKLSVPDRQKMLNALLGEYGDTDSFVMKDPRLCLTLSAWLPTLEVIGAAVRVLIVLRHPAEILRSLTARNNLPEGETAPEWLHHMLEAERISRGFKRAVFAYDDLLRDWRGCMDRAGQTAGIFWPRRFDDAGAEIDDFLTTSSRNFAKPELSAALGGGPVKPMVAAAWAALIALAGNPGDRAAMQSLDEIRKEFSGWRRQHYPPGVRAVFPRAGKEGIMRTA